MRHVLATICAVSISLGFASTASATTIVNVVCDVEKVVLEPDATAPTRIQIHGVFALAEGGPGKPYSAAKRGYLYLACPAGREADCKTHFLDIQKAIGDVRCAGIGQAGEALPTVRAEGVTPTAADTYSFGLGVMMSEWHGGACAATKAVPDAGSPPDAGAPDTGIAPPVDTGVAATDTGTTTPAAAPAAESGGCTTGRASTSGSFALIAAALMFAIRRRR
jgi:MYXO-CTERM domain-containing protein